MTLRKFWLGDFPSSQEGERPGFREEAIKVPASSHQTRGMQARANRLAV